MVLPGVSTSPRKISVTNRLLEIFSNSWKDTTYLGFLNPRYCLGFSKPPLIPGVFKTPTITRVFKTPTIISGLKPH